MSTKEYNKQNRVKIMRDYEQYDKGTYPEMFKSTSEYCYNENDKKDFEAYDEPYLEDVYREDGSVSNAVDIGDHHLLRGLDKGEPFYQFFNDIDDAVAELKRMEYRGQIYTEIEGDTGGLWYDRGFHLVNRTGNYVILFDPQYRVMEYTE